MGHFFVAAVLDGVGYVGGGRVDAEGPALGGGGFGELAGGDEAGGDAAAFKV